MMDMPRPSLWGDAPPRSYVRETLTEGLVQQAIVSASIPSSSA